MSEWQEHGTCSYCGRESTRVLVHLDPHLESERIYPSLCEICVGWLGNAIRAQDPIDVTHHLARAMAEFRWEMREAIAALSKAKDA